MKAASIADVAKPTNKMGTEDGKCVDLRGAASETSRVDEAEWECDSGGERHCRAKRLWSGK